MPIAQQSVAAIRLHGDDDVVVALRGLRAGETVVLGDGEPIEVRGDVPPGHKCARRARAPGEIVRKYGQPIGIATAAIAPGEHVHSHNLALGGARGAAPIATAVPDAPAPIAGRTFPGFRRADGRIGTRNYVAVISSVNCSASVSRFICERFDDAALEDFPHVDGVLALTHKGGCAIAPGGEEQTRLARTIAGVATHPNVGAYLLVGLGCETNHVASILDSALRGRDAVPTLVMQEEGGTAATVAAGVKALAGFLPEVNRARREPVPASGIVLGLQCGGSDGNSGISSNPVLGAASDRVVACGGTAVLAETPEVYGAEGLLTARARSPAVAERLLAHLRWWEDYADRFGGSIDNNPTTGNKAGGLTTIYEKSLGAVAKGGSTALEAVYGYADPIRTKGFAFMDSPGFDPASVTGLVAGGANLVCFSTGRGSCFGCKPTPIIKVASNTAMYEQMRDDMDFDAGAVLRGAAVGDLGAALFELILDVAGGTPTASERLGYGDDEFCPWSTGPVF